MKRKNLWIINTRARGRLKTRWRRRQKINYNADAWWCASTSSFNRIFTLHSPPMVVHLNSIRYVSFSSSRFQSLPMSVVARIEERVDRMVIWEEELQSRAFWMEHKFLWPRNPLKVILILQFKDSWGHWKGIPNWIFCRCCLWLL